MTKEELYGSLMTKKMQKSLLKVARNYDPINAEDVLQDVALITWDKLERFNGGSFFSWACTILKNCLKNRWRSSRVKRNGQYAFKKEAISIDYAIEFKRAYVLAPEDVDNSYSDEMKYALESVPPALREVILLVAVDDLTYDEAAKKMGIPAGTVMSRVFRAKDKMRKSLEMVP